MDVTVGFLKMSLDPLFAMHPNIQVTASPRHHAPNAWYGWKDPLAPHSDSVNLTLGGRRYANTDIGRVAWAKSYAHIPE